MAAPTQFALLGLAPPRAGWFRAVGQWATSASLPAEFVKCVSGEELRARLSGGRAWSAVLIDAGTPAADRDLVDAARRAGAVVLIIDDGRTSRDWLALDASAVLPATFDCDALLDALRAVARPVSTTGAAGTATTRTVPVRIDGPRGRVLTVLGPGGTGTSTVAIALAQAAAAARRREHVLLADLKLHAEQAVLHDAQELVPGVQELVEAHRAGAPTAADVRATTFHVVERGYDLLLGLRRARSWSTLRPRAVAAAIESLRRTYGTVVCDVDADLEGEAESGAVEVEERHVLARAAVAASDVVVAVGEGSFKGVHALGRVITELLGFGVAPVHIVPVINRAGRGRNQRDVARALAAVLERGAHDAGDSRVPAPVFAPDRRGIGEALHDGIRLPDAIGHVVLGAVDGVLDWADLRDAPSADPEPVRIRPGSVGTFRDIAGAAG
jgi:MinD-like ATPase involved in chromosome partitioning or flagellar assembly